MAKVPDRLVGPAQVATGPTTVFTAPAGGTLVRWVRVSNPSGSPATFTLSVGADAAATRVYDVVTVAAGGTFADYPYLELDEGEVLQASSDTNNVLVLTVGGDALQGSSLFEGARVLGPFPFAYNDAGLNDGVAFYTPTPGDILLDLWIEIVTAWDGTTPSADVGTFVNSDNGWGLYKFRTPQGPVDLNIADDESHGEGMLIASTDNESLSRVGVRVAPSRFTSANPLKIVVSQDGVPGSSAPGASQGQANIYLVIATPYVP